MASWSRLDAASTTLSSLVGHSANVVQKELVILGGTHRLDDIHNSAHYAGSVRTLCLESSLASTASPQGLCPRLGFHKGVPILKKREILVFGGRQETLSNALYAYNFGIGSWREVATSGTLPAARYGHSFTRVSENAVMVFGGDVGQGPIDDIFFLSLSDKKWSRSQADGRPSPRAFHTATLVGDAIYVCGGTTSSGLDNGLYAYKVVTKQWSKLSCSGSPPQPRYGHAAIALGHLLIIAGGVTSAGVQKDVHVFDTRLCSWSKASSCELPKPCCYHSLSVHRKMVFCLSVEGCWKRSTDSIVAAVSTPGPVDHVERSGVKKPLKRTPTPTPACFPGQGPAKIGLPGLQQAIADLLILAKKNLDASNSKQQQVIDAIDTLNALAAAPKEERPPKQRLKLEPGRKPLTRSKDLPEAAGKEGQPPASAFRHTPPGKSAGLGKKSHPLAASAKHSPPGIGLGFSKSPEKKLTASQPLVSASPAKLRPGKGKALPKSPRGPVMQRGSQSTSPREGFLSPIRSAPPASPASVPAIPEHIMKKALPKPPSQAGQRAGNTGRRGPRPGVASMPNASVGALVQREVLSQIGSSRDFMSALSPRGGPSARRPGSGEASKPPLPKKPEPALPPAKPPKTLYGSSGSEEEYEEGEQRTFSCSGYVWKRKKKKNFLSSWKLRYFLLCNSVVYYYSTPHDTKPLGEFNISCTRVRRITADDVTTHIKDKKPFCMELTTPESTYHIATETKEDLDRWISCLQAVMEQIMISGEDSIVTKIAGPSESDIQLMKRSRPSMVLTSNITSKVKASRFPTLKAKRMQDFQITREDIGDGVGDASDDDAPPPPPVDASPEAQLQAIIHEIIETERDYVGDLRIIIDVYLKTLVEICGIRDSDKDAVFGNIEELLPLHVKLVSDLEKTEARQESVGKVFHLYAAQFMLYAQYCATQASSKQVLQRLCDENPNIGACLDETKAKPECKQLDLASYLIKPMQRLCKYPLLLRELHKHLDEGTDAAQVTATAIEKIGHVVKEVNESKRLVDNVIELAAIEKSIVDRELSLQQRGRAIVRREEFKKVTVGATTSKSTIWLFSDLVLVAKKKERDRYNFRCLANLADCIVWDLDPAGNAPAEKRFAFSIVQTGLADKITVLAGSQQEKSSWISDLNDCIGTVSGGFV